MHWIAATSQLHSPPREGVSNSMKGCFTFHVVMRLVQYDTMRCNNDEGEFK